MAALADTAAMPSGVLGPPSAPCILVVEDDEADAYLICRALSDNPAVGRVVHARDGLEALALVERGEVKPDLAFIDLRMPRMDGFDLLVAFSSCLKLDFPMVVLTSSAARRDAIRSRLRRAIRVITKPDKVAELYAVLETTVEDLIRPGARMRSAKAGRSTDYLPTSPRFFDFRFASGVDEVDE